MQGGETLGSYLLNPTAYSKNIRLQVCQRKYVTVIAKWTLR